MSRFRTNRFVTSVDYATDELIGKTIRQSVCSLLHQRSSPDVSFSEFADSTILTIAHRLRTIIDYDRVSGMPMFL